MKELTARRNEKQAVICVTNLGLEGSNQSCVETVASDLKVRRGPERWAGKACGVAIQTCAEEVSNISESTPSKAFQQI